MANVKISELPLGNLTQTSTFPFVDAGTTYQGAISAITSNSTVEVTYSELVDKITGETLNTGSYYIITDFKTCYDQPDYDYNSNAITSGNYRQSSVEPIIVFATSNNTISENAYQPTYPNDTIKYDWTFSETEVTQGVAYGRISERIDEYNNRTDYDHRTIEFKRYRYYEISFNSPQTGTLNVLPQSETEMVVTGTGTNFQSLSVNQIVGFTNSDVRVYEITNIISNTEMIVTGLTNTELYDVKVCPTDQLNYSSYFQNNISTTDFVTYPTFNYSANTCLNTYIGNFSNLHNFYEEYFMLSNNVFLNYSVNNNFGDGCYNNSFLYFKDNQIKGNFYRNIIENDFYSNVIGINFNNNRMSVGFYYNQIGSNFNSNYLASSNFNNNNIGNYFQSNLICGGNFSGNKIGNDLSYNKIYNNFNNNICSNSFEGNEIKYSFYENTIGYSFSDNTVFSTFYSNQIGNNFYENIIGDDGNIGTFEFYRNRIGNSFNNNTVNNYFQNNQIGNQFNSNLVYGSFYKNVIGNGYNNNSTGYDFYGNHIGNGMYSNIVRGNSYSNQIGEYFNSNFISYNFQDNVIGNSFENNTLGNTDYFSWDNTNIENLTARTYDTFYRALNQNVGNYILGLDMIMHDTVNDEYHKVKFTQWTQGGQGGGFAYERTKVYPTVEPTVYFKRTNYGSEVDVIVEGSLEITRGNGGGAIYNIAAEAQWHNNSSPLNTEWNSIYTQGNNGSGFQYNSIGNQFKGNLIFNYFDLNNINSYVGYNEFFGSVTGNKIGAYTFGNTFSGSVSVNSWEGDFYSNNIEDGFQSNTLGVGINGNTIGINFQDNTIGSYFANNTIGDNFGFGYSVTQGNRIGNNFFNNTIGEYFYNNLIPDNFHDSQVGNYFQWNVINTNIDTTNFTLNYGNITGFSYTATGTSAVDNLYIGIDICGTTQSSGVEAKFDVEVSGGSVIGVSGNTEGRLYKVNDILTILGTQIGGVHNVIVAYSNNGIGKNGVDGTYPELSVTGGDGTNANFDVNVSGGLVNSVNIYNVGTGYEVGNTLTILGSQFGGTNGVDDITITVDSIYTDDIVITVTGVTPSSLFYEHYTKQIFERKLGNKRVSYYDENDILNIDSIYEVSGYIPVYSQSLSFPINYTSVEFKCDGNYTNTIGYTGNQTNSTQDVVSLFNSNFRSFGYFFDNNDGTIGLYINPSLKQQFCSSGAYTIYVFND